MARATEDDDYVPASRAGTARRSQFGGCLQLPEGVSFWKKTDGKHTFRLVPYTVGDHNSAAEAGKKFHTLSFWQHANVGPDGIKVLCAKKMKGAPDKRCAVCELRAKMIADGESEKDTDQLKPKERSVFLALIDGEEEVQVYEDSFHAFCKALNAAIDLGDEGEFDMLAHPTEGARLVIARFEEKSLGGDKTWSPAETVSLNKEADPLTKAQRNHGVCLDECLVWPNYKELSEMLLGKHADDDAGDEERPTKKGTTKKSSRGAESHGGNSSDEDDDDDEPAPPKKRRSVDDEDDDEPPKKAAKKPSKPVDDDEDDDEPSPPKKRRPAADDDEEDEEPPKKPAKKPAKPADDDEEDDEPPKKTAKKKPAADDDDDEPPKKAATKKPSKPVDDDDWD